MLPLLFHMQNLPADTSVTTNFVHFLICWPRPYLYNKKEFIGGSRR